MHPEPPAFWARGQPAASGGKSGKSQNSRTWCTRRGVSAVSTDTVEVQLTVGTALDGLHAGHPLVLRGRDAVAHTFALGLTGSGKSSLLDAVCVQSVNQHIGCLYLDPHGDGCRNVLRLLAHSGFYTDPRAYQRVLYLPLAGRGDRFVPLNVLAQPSYDAHDVARLILEAWTRAWPTLAGGAAPVIEQLVLAGCYTLICNKLPLTFLGRLLSESTFRQRLLAQVDDEEVIACFQRFDAAGRRGGLLSESTLRRTFSMFFSHVVRFSLGSLQNVLQLPQLIAHNVTVLCDLSRLDEETQRFLGCLIMVLLEAATLARAELPPQERHPYRAIIDEAPVFMSQSAVSFEHLLAQARKFGVSLTLAAQVWGQTRKLQSVLPNATLVAFRLSRDDASNLTPWLFAPDPYRIKHQVADPYRAATSHPVYMSLTEQRAEFEQLLQRLPPREALVRVGSETTRIRTVKLPDLDRGPQGVGDDIVDPIIDHYAQALLIPRSVIEAQWRHWQPLPPPAQVSAQGQWEGEQQPTQTPPPTVPPPTPGQRPRRRRLAPLHGEDDADGENTQARRPHGT